MFVFPIKAAESLTLCGEEVDEETVPMETEGGSGGEMVEDGGE